jgi:hypothetical protein
MVKLTTEEVAFLREVEAGKIPHLRLLDKLGFGWAVRAGFVRRKKPHDGTILDLEITAAGRAALRESGE